MKRELAIEFSRVTEAAALQAINGLAVATKIPQTALPSMPCALSLIRSILTAPS